MSHVHYAIVDPSGKVLVCGRNTADVDPDVFAQANSYVGSYRGLTDAQFTAVRESPARRWVYLTESGDISHTEPFELPTDSKWEEIKGLREAALCAPLVTPFGVFDASPISQANILKACQLASTLVTMGQPVAINFTLHDNTVVVMDGQSMVMVGLMLGQREQEIRSHATYLRSRIYTPGADLSTITW